jgi:phosphoenolpyruvate-protein kinase (PTS system EI component)
VRTELVFAGRRAAPSEAEQRAALTAIAAKARGGPVVARLFDAGGDKPLAWLAPPAANPEARGMELLLAHPDVLAAQVRAIASADVHALLPLVRGPSDIDAVRALAPGRLSVGAMIETKNAVQHIDAIARAADFICIGTNDLTAEARGEGREASSYAIDPRVLALVARTVKGAHAAGRKVTVCGEIAGDAEGARVLVGLGVDALSVAPGKLGAVRAALASATREECAQAALRATTSIDAR